MAINLNTSFEDIVGSNIVDMASAVIDENDLREAVNYFHEDMIRKLNYPTYNAMTTSIGDDDDDPWGYNSSYDVPEDPICTSCGEQHEAQEFDERDRCENSVNKFWGKVRKLYWHRVSQTGKKIKI